VVEHLVLIKWKTEPTLQEMTEMMDAMNGLKAQIPVIVDASCGENFSARSQGYTFGATVRFQDKEGLKAYGPHPAHQYVVQNYILPRAESMIVLDYEF